MLETGLSKGKFSISIPIVAKTLTLIHNLPIYFFSVKVFPKLRNYETTKTDSKRSDYRCSKKTNEKCTCICTGLRWSYQLKDRATVTCQDILGTKAPSFILFEPTFGPWTRRGMPNSDPSWAWVAIFPRSSGVSRELAVISIAWL